ncbi:MAG: Gfo/Idh/MocA family protein [Enterocloster bolteae]
MKRVVIGIIGSGFAAELHACAYQKVCGVEVVLKAVSSLDPAAEEFARRYGISAVYEDYHEMLKDPEIDMVDIIAPPCLHADMVMDVVRSKKHVICEKPLTGFLEKEKRN